jgi:MoaA/NifB/PqqE/SkfB family radical SAM enzyme
MPSTLTTLRRRAKALHRNLRGASMTARALASTDHPLLAHIIPVRRCNLACTYCNEFDDFSKPVPTEEMFRRIDKLGDLGTSVVTISGGSFRVYCARLIRPVKTRFRCGSSPEGINLRPDTVTRRSQHLYPGPASAK